MVNRFFYRLLHDENGAVTVDWVVLTAAIVLLAVAVLSVISPALDRTTSEIAATINSVIT